MPGARQEARLLATGDCISQHLRDLHIKLEQTPNEAAVSSALVAVERLKVRAVITQCISLNLEVCI